MKKSTSSGIRSSPSPSCSSGFGQAAVNERSKAGSDRPGRNRDEGEADMPEPGQIFAPNGLRPSPSGSNSLGVSGTAVNKTRPVPSSPSPPRRPPPLYLYRAATGTAVDAEQKVLLRIDSGFAGPTFGTDGRGARVIPARTPPRHWGPCDSSTVVSEAVGEHV